MGTRAQAFTLEGVLAALVVLAGVAFALQAVVVTPSTGGATASPVDTETVDSVLAGTAESGALKRAALAWDNGRFDGASGSTGHFVGDLPANEFGTALDQAVGRSVSVNVVVYYEDSSGTRQSERLAYNGIPGDGAVRSTATVAVFDSDTLYTESGDPRGVTVSPTTFYVGDRHSGSDLYAVLEVEVIAWRA